VSESLLIAQEACKKSLKFLCTEMLGYKDWDTIHDELEVFLNRPSKRKALLVPRGHLKTSIVTIGKTTQILLNEPNARILIANQVWDISRKMLFEIKEHLERSNLKHLFGDFVSDKWNADTIVIRQRDRAIKEASITTTGTEAESTGGHFDYIILDDLIGHQNSATFELREKAKRFRRSMFNLIEPDGLVLDVGTRWHLDDCFSEIIEKESKYYDIMIRQVVENGRIIFPKKFSKRFNATRKTWEYSETPCMDYINYLRETLTTSEFSSQYMNNPVDEENQVFKPAYFKKYERRPENLYLAMTVDPAISDKQGSDYSVIVVAGMDDQHNIYVMDYVRGHWTPHELIERMFTTYLKWKPSAIGLETVAFQKSLKYFLEEKMMMLGVHFPIEEIRRGSNASKEFRIKALEPYYRGGRVYHASWMKDLEDELVTFPKGKHDDIIDALSDQLELLLPGSVDHSFQIPPGSWEDIRQTARRMNMQYRSFFQE
jgi:predicted phage terminase large subunit-like protein